MDRALAALTGLAIGDALGMPTQSLSRHDIQDRYGTLDGFRPGPPDQPIAPGLPAGTVTDDTEQALLLARLVIAGHGHVDPHALADGLAAWERDMRARGSLDLLGPSTKAAITALAAGEPIETAGRHGTTNGAAMRVTPVGIACATTDLVDRVVEASSVTHNTGVALAGAAAVAAAVSAGMSGGGVAEAIAAAIPAARTASGRGHWVAAADVADRIAWAAGSTPHVTDPAGHIYRLVGTSVATQESVPAAFAVLATCPDDPWRACLMAASLGGDCDTIAAMVGAIAGACHGEGAFPAAAVATVCSVNDLPLESLARDLVRLRG